MENNNDKSIFDEFGVNEETKTHLTGIAQWANINVIIACVALGITAIATLMEISRYGNSAGILELLITAAITLLLNITLYHAATNIKKGVTMPDQGFLEGGVNKLASYFKITGILTIIGLIIIVLALLVGILAGASRGF